MVYAYRSNCTYAWVANKRIGEYAWRGGKEFGIRIGWRKYLYECTTFGYVDLWIRPITFCNIYFSCSIYARCMDNIWSNHLTYGNLNCINHNMFLLNNFVWTMFIPYIIFWKIRQQYHLFPCMTAMLYALIQWYPSYTEKNKRFWLCLFSQFSPVALHSCKQILGNVANSIDWYM